MALVIYVCSVVYIPSLSSTVLRSHRLECREPFQFNRPKICLLIFALTSHQLFHIPIRAHKSTIEKPCFWSHKPNCEMARKINYTYVSELTEHIERPSLTMVQVFKTSVYFLCVVG
jgi:hypothetical protein